MTSAPVKNPADVMYVARKDSTPSPKGDGNFAGDLMDAVQKSGQNAVKAPKDEGVKQAVKKTETVKNDRKNFDRTDKNRPNASKPDGKESLRDKGRLTDDQSDTVNQKIDSLIGKIREATDVDEEDILYAMENLGLTGADLFSPENMTNLLMELTGTEDPMELVTDESLFTSLQDLNLQAGEIMGQLQEALELSPEDMQDVMKQIAEQNGQLMEEELPADTQETAETLQVSDKAAGAEETGKITDPAAGSDAMVSEEPAADISAVNEESKTSSGEENTNNQNTAGENGFSEEASQIREAGGKERHSNEHRVNQRDAQHTDHQQIQNFNQQMPGNELDAIQEEPAVSYTERTAQTQRIADQIMEHMKVQMKEGVTELEMQLHPASLGNVNVSLVSREGNITAQFTAQNEAVKNAIETQIVQLKEQFEVQGIKVEAVEVSVSSQQFDRQYSDAEQKESGQQGSRSRRTRRINLETLSDEEISRLTEDADRIQVDMMNRNGNTVDYTV